MNSIYCRSSLYEPLKIADRRREGGVPAGLKNIGNTCFINSLLQCYFMIPPLVKEIMLAHFKSNGQELSGPCLFVKELQNLFAMMIGSISKYADPRFAIECLVNSAEQRIELGNQEDIGEFHMIFVENLEKGLSESHQESHEWMGKSLKDQGKIESLFTGDQKELLIYKTSDRQENNLQEKDAKFSQIILDLEEGELYAAWEKHNKGIIQDFKTENGEIVTSKQEIWIENLPDILMFQIKRHYFIQGDHYPSKDNSKFEFPPILYCDRMMWKNRQQIKLLKKECKQHRKELKNIINSIESLKFPNNAELSALDSISVLINLLETPEYKKRESVTEIIGLRQNLSFLLNDIENQVKILESRKLELEHKLSDFYQGLQQNYRYDLHSILIHEGVASSGHYYAFIKDLDREDIWRNYNDIFVTEMSFTDIMKIAEGGGQSMASAYCLVYVKHEVLDNQSGMSRISFSAEDVVELNDEYTSYISDETLLFINSQNKLEDKERDALTIDSNINKVISKCQQYWESIKKFAENKALKNEKYIYSKINNFATYLFMNYKEDLCRWYILDISMKDSFGTSLRDLPDEVIKERLRKLSKEKEEIPYRFELSASDYQSYEILLNQFKEEIQGAEMALLILKSANEFKKDIYIRAFFFFFQFNKENSEISRAMFEIYYLLLLCFVYNLFHSGLKANNIEVIQDCCESIHFLLPLSTGKLCDKIIDLLKNMKNSFKQNFLRLKIKYEEAFNLALLSDIDYSIFFDNIPEEINNLKVNFEDNDYFYNWRDESKPEGLVLRIRDQFVAFYNQKYYTDKMPLYIIIKGGNKLKQEHLEDLA